MRVCVCLHTYIDIYTHIYVHIYIYIYIYIHAYIWYELPYPSTICLIVLLLSFHKNEFRIKLPKNVDMP